MPIYCIQLILFFFIHIFGQYSSSPCFTTQIATLWSPTDSSKTSGTYNFPLTWNSALSNITSATLAINSFRVETQMGFQTTIIFTATNGIINFVVLSGFQITFIQYHIILVSSCSGKIEAAHINRYCTTLSPSPRSADLQIFNWTSTKFPTFSASSDYQIKVFLVSYYGTSATYHEFQPALSQIFPSCLQIKVYSHPKTNHGITKVVLSIVIFQISSFYQNILIFYTINSIYSSGINNFTSNFAVQSKFSPGYYSNNCIYSITWICMSELAPGPNQIHHLNSGGTISSINHINIDFIDYTILCMIQCSPSYIINSAVSANTCVLCSTLLTGCNQCQNSTYCNTCKQFYDFQAGGTCLINCTSIQYCATCSVPSTALNCLTCQTGYQSNSTNCNPVCGDGFIAVQQECDDGNSFSNDGCSNSCAFQLRFYCIINITINICHPCSSLCLTCIDENICSQCQITSYMLNKTTNVVCYNTCPVNYFGFNTSSTLRNCLPCPYDCLTCINETTCTICQLGMIVQGGCSRASGCTEVTQNSLLMRSPCISCQPTLILDWQTCTCQFGYWMVTRFCTNVVGCVSTSLNGSNVICIACDKSKILSLINGTCICRPGLVLNSSSICQQICGDGILYQMQCDDGNKMNGDGCSSQCKIQFKYSCFNGSTIHRSICMYMGKDFKIVFDSVVKVQNQNKARIILNFFPNLKNFDSLSLIDNISFQCNKTASMSSWSYSQGKMQLQIDYGEQVEGADVNISINFDHTYVPQADIKINCNMVAKGAKLFYMSSYSNAKTMEYVFLGLNCLIFIMFVLGSISHKMIGVETIHTFQLIFFIHSMSTDYTYSFSMFKYLTYLNANFMYFFNKQLNIPNPSDSFVFNINNKQISIIGIFILCLVAVLINIAFKIKAFMAKIIRIKLKYDEITIKIYHHLVFPIVIGFYLANLAIFNIMIENKKISLLMNFNTHLGSLIYFLLMGLTAIIFCFQCQGIMVNKQYENQYYGLVKCRSNYLPAYLVYIFLSNLSLVLYNLNYFSYSSIFIVGLTSLFFLKYCCNKPYQKNIHNAGLMYNCLMIIFFGGWSLLRNKVMVIKEQNIEFIILIAVLIIMVISCIITFFRIISQFRQNYLNKNEQNKEKKQQIYQSQKIQIQQINQLTQPLEKYNQYCLNLIRKKQKANQWNEINKKRLLNNYDIIYSKKEVENNIESFNKLFIHKAKQKTTQNDSPQKKQLKSILRQSFKKKIIDIQKKLKVQQNDQI